jgi:hypothetical protein
MSERAPFAPSPRPQPPISTALLSLMRRNAVVAACVGRAERNTRTYYCGADPVWRWLFRPALPPSVDDDARP